MHVWALGLSCETPAASGPPGLAHDSPRAQTCTFCLRVPALQKHHQNSTSRHPERHKKSEMVAGEGKKSAKFWAPHPSGPHPAGPHPSGPTLRGHPSGQVWPIKDGQKSVWPKSVSAGSGALKVHHGAYFPNRLECHVQFIVGRSSPHQSLWVIPIDVGTHQTLVT